MRKLKIVGSFSTIGTKVIDLETGQEIRNVEKVTWIHEAGKLPQCIIELVNVTCEGEAEEIEA